MKKKVVIPELGTTIFPAVVFTGTGVLERPQSTMKKEKKKKESARGCQAVFRSESHFTKREVIRSSEHWQRWKVTRWKEKTILLQLFCLNKDFTMKNQFNPNVVKIKVQYHKYHLKKKKFNRLWILLKHFFHNVLWQLTSHKAYL